VDAEIESIARQVESAVMLDRTEPGTLQSSTPPGGGRRY
jgi:hypothetical protein